MSTVTIPKEMTKGEELVIIPRRVYEQFLHLGKIVSSYAHLPKGVQEALEDVRKGRMIGPFSSLKEGLTALKSAK